MTPADPNALYPCVHRKEDGRCPVCSRPRTLIQAVKDVSAVRDLPIWCFELIRPMPRDVVSLADERAKRRA